MEGGNMYEKILVPIDGSDTATLGLNEAIKLAKSQGGRIRLVHVVNEFILDPMYSPDTYSGTLIESMREGGRAILNRADAMVRQQGIDSDVVLLESIGGAAAELIAAQAKEWPADIIVMGTHGRRGLRRLAMGSDAEGVMRIATVPVLFVKGSANTR
jgi:nucleotide-binding universal stress UspA family protein